MQQSQKVKQRELSFLCAFVFCLSCTSGTCLLQGKNDVFDICLQLDSFSACMPESQVFWESPGSSWNSSYVLLSTLSFKTNQKIQEYFSLNKAIFMRTLQSWSPNLFLSKSLPAEASINHTVPPYNLVHEHIICHNLEHSVTINCRLGVPNLKANRHSACWDEMYTHCLARYLVTWGFFGSLRPGETSCFVPDPWTYREITFSLVCFSCGHGLWELLSWILSGCVTVALVCDHSTLSCCWEFNSHSSRYEIGRILAPVRYRFAAG